LIGYRALRLAGDGERLGLYGFGASAHIVAQLARAEGRSVYAFTRPGDTGTQEFARGLGAVWAGGSLEQPPAQLDCAIIFAAAGELIPAALSAVCKGGVVVCAGIHMSEIPAFSYDLLWGERVVRSVANLTRRDAEEFFDLAARQLIATSVSRYALDGVAQALEDLRQGRFAGAAVIDVSGSK
jgi:propanol-preferring alcohol dehydrogenase